jgi:hypothetical protein
MVPGFAPRRKMPVRHLLAQRLGRVAKADAARRVVARRFMDTPIDSALVHRFSCFQALNADQIAAFAAHLEEVPLPAGKVLFPTGRPRGLVLPAVKRPDPDQAGRTGAG